MAQLEDLRTKTGELLDEGLKTGALTPEEHSWRRGHLVQASSVDALESLVQDLLTPASGPPVVRSAQTNVLSNRSFTALDLGTRAEVVTVLGSTRIDLHGVTSGQPLNVELVTVLGDVSVEVPPGLKVRVDVTPVMGDCRVASGLQSSDADIRLTGVVLLGSLRVSVK